MELKDLKTSDTVLLKAIIVILDEHKEVVRLADMDRDIKLSLIGAVKSSVPIEYKVQSLVQTICRVYNIPASNLKSKSREYDKYLEPRIMYSYINREHFERIYKAIGKDIKRDHASILNNVNRAKVFLNRRSRDKGFYIKFMEIKNVLLEQYDISLVEKDDA